MKPIHLTFKGLKLIASRCGVTDTSTEDSCVDGINSFLSQNGAGADLPEIKIDPSLSLSHDNVIVVRQKKKNPLLADAERRAAASQSTD